MHDDVKDIIANLDADAHRFSGKTILLSGGGGFLGRHFIAVDSFVIDPISTPGNLRSRERRTAFHLAWPDLRAAMNDACRAKSSH